MASFSSAQKSKLKSRYGLSPADWNGLFAAQGGRCPICLRHQRQLKTRLCVDHNHSDGTIRGLLCRFCNQERVGRLQGESGAQLFERAAAHLRHKTGFVAPGYDKDVGAKETTADIKTEAKQ